MSSDAILTFGEWLRRRRGGLGLTQSELAKQLGCAPVSLRKIEAEERRPSPQTAERLATLLGVPREQRSAFIRFARGDIRAGEHVQAAPTQPASSGSHSPPVTPSLPSDSHAIQALPMPPYAIVGRDEVITRATQLLFGNSAKIGGKVRVLTLVGPPGVGKTRLSLELAHRLGPRFRQGATFVELAPVHSASLVSAALAQALHIEDSDAADTSAAVLNALRDQHRLLILDNFEHLIEAAPFVARLVAACANVWCIVTSRERLRIRAEHVLDVPILEVPQTSTLPAVRSASASRLFVERSRQANPVFKLARTNAQPIVDVCAQLEGLPLALELLAARADEFTPGELRDQLRRGLDALEHGPRDLPDRHQSLRSAIAWSTERLGERERRLFAHLAVFAGSFDADAAQAVLTHDSASLATLARVSLIGPAHIDMTPSRGPERWRILEPIRQFAEELLKVTRELGTAKARHAAYYAGVAQRARDGMLSADAESWMMRLENEQADMQSALAWSLEAGRPLVTLTIGQGIFRFWHRRGMWREGFLWLERALAFEDDVSPDAGQGTQALTIRARAARAAGMLAHTLSQYDQADRYLHDSLALAYKIEDDEQVAAAYFSLGIVRKDQGRFEEALNYFDQSIELEPARARKFPWQSKADTLLRLGRFDEADALYRKAMALNIEIGDEDGLGHTLRGLGEIAWRRGDADTAETFYRQSEVICRKLSHTRALSWISQQLGNVARVRGDWREALERYAEALTALSRMGDRWGVCETLVECAHLAVATQQFAHAVRWLGMAQAGFRALGARLTDYEQGLIAATRETCAQHLDEQTRTELAQAGAQDWRAGALDRVTSALPDLAPSYARG